MSARNLLGTLAIAACFVCYGLAQVPRADAVEASGKCKTNGPVGVPKPLELPLIGTTDPEKCFMSVLSLKARDMNDAHYSDYQIRWEAMPPNGDWPRSCADAIAKVSGHEYREFLNDTRPLSKKCGLYLSNLYFYDNRKGNAPTWVGQTWGGGRPLFDLLRAKKPDGKEILLLAYYDQNRVATVRDLLSGAEKKFPLTPADLSERNTVLIDRFRKSIWDGHNGLALGVDERGFIHLAADMHHHPMFYFRSTGPFDLMSLERTPFTGGNPDESDHVTYPSFSGAKNGGLLFSFRDSDESLEVSENRQFLLKYEMDAPKWTVLPRIIGGQDGDVLLRPYDSELVTKDWVYTAVTWHEIERHCDGRKIGVNERCNGGLRLISDNNWSRNISFARRNRYNHQWYSMLPRQSNGSMRFWDDFKVETADLVDTVPRNCGIHHSELRVGFFYDDDPVVSYGKYEDCKGSTAPSQVFNAYFDRSAGITGAWKVSQATRWRERFLWSGSGTADPALQRRPSKVEAGSSCSTKSKYGPVVRKGKSIFQQLTPSECDIKDRTASSCDNSGEGDPSKNRCFEMPLQPQEYFPAAGCWQLDAQLRAWKKVPKEKERLCK